VKAVVLVGGEGTRLRPLTDTRPKQLLPIVGVPMIERVVEGLAGSSVEEVVLSLGYRPDAFLGRYGRGDVHGVPVRCVVEPEPLDTGGAIAFAVRQAGIDSTFVAVNGDVLSDLVLSDLVATHRRCGGQATLALVTVRDPSRFGVVVTASDGRVEAFVEKPPDGRAPASTVNAGCYILEPTVLDRVPSGRRVSVERQIFPELVDEGVLFARVGSEYWLDTGTPEAYLQAHQDLLQGRRGPLPAPGATCRGAGLWACGEVHVGGAVTGGSFVGAGSTVAYGAEVIASSLGAQVTVEAGASLQESVLLDGARVGAGARVGGSIVGAGAVIGAGAQVAAASVIGDGATVPAGDVLYGARVPAALVR
jgi:mannose-1-phosphate guanylyltransferase